MICRSEPAEVPVRRDCVGGGKTRTGNQTVISRIRPQGDRIRLRWQERNGPPVKPPSYYGFGTRILRQGVAQELDGEVVLDYKPDGVVCQIMMSRGEGPCRVA
jgi:two-component sensor histidine kinase